MDFQKFSVVSPAKINVNLSIGEKRPDGFHNLKSVFYSLNFGDILHFEPVLNSNNAEIVMNWENYNGFPVIDITLEENIIFKAVSLFREKTGICHGTRITAEKHIPIGGGLGGGSSNAASTLLALNKLAGCPLTRENLLEMGLSLGSDVPFFIYETAAAIVSGRGEHITPIDVPVIIEAPTITEAPNVFVVLVNPGFPSDTAAAFRLLDAVRTVKETDSFLEVFLEPEKSVYENIIAKLLELGAQKAGLSGAGSTCFGIFNEKETAENAAANMRKKWIFSECTFVRKF